MPRALILLGIALLLALAVTALLDDGTPEAGRTDGTREEAWRAGDPAAAKAGTQGGPKLIGTGEAAERTDESIATDAVGPKEPTGPYTFIVMAFESEALLADVAITDDGGEPLGKTDDDGELLVEDAGVSGLRYRATKDGYVPHHAHAQPGRLTVIVLQPGVSITGRVVHAKDSKPIADASIGVWDEDLGHEVAAVSTDEEGRYRIRSVRPNHPVQIIVRTEAYVPHVQRELFYVPLEDFEIRVGDGGRLIGRVSDGDDKPLPNMEVRLLWGHEPLIEHRSIADDDARSGARLAGLRTAVTRTDAEGMYAFLGVPLGRHVVPVAIVKPRFVVKSVGHGGHTFRDLDETKRLDIVVPEPCALRIRIEDEKRAPIGHAEVHLRAGRSVWPLLPADAHEEGGYLVRDLPVSTVEVTATLPGAPIQQARVEFATGQTSEVTLTFPIGRTLAGVVKDKRGEPIWKALVSWNGATHGEHAATRTDTRGRFALSRLTSEAGTLVVSARDLPYTLRAYERRVFENWSPGPRDLEVTLLDGTQAFGRFLDLPKGAVVSSWIAGGTPFDAVDHHVKPEGRFTRRGPPKGNPALFVFRTRGYPPLLVEEPRPFQSEEVRDLGPLLFEATNPRLGRVVDEQKRPIHGARIELQTRWSKRATRTDVVGDFAFPRLPDKRIPIEITADGFPVTRATLETSSQFHRQVIRIQRAGPLYVEVFHARGPVRGPVRITVFEPAKAGHPGDPAPIRQVRMMRAHQTAAFHLPPGRYLVHAHLERAGRPLEGVQAVTIGTAPQPRVRVPLEVSK